MHQNEKMLLLKKISKTIIVYIFFNFLVNYCQNN